MAEIDKRKAAAFALVLIAGFEGYSHRAIIPVPGDPPTICRGHTYGVHLGDTATDAECDGMTEADITAVFNQIYLPNIPSEVMAATVDFCFNVGITRCKSSTLYAYLKAGKYRAACDEFPRWIYAHGKPYPGLIRRRQAERELCMKGIK